MRGLMQVARQRGATGALEGKHSGLPHSHLGEGILALALACRDAAGGEGKISDDAILHLSSYLVGLCRVGKTVVADSALGCKRFFARKNDFSLGIWA